MSINLTKINLKKEGDWASIPVKNLHCRLVWTAPVDLDLHAYYLSKNERKNNIFSRLFKGKPSHSKNEGLVYFGNYGSENKFPYICLDQDAGVGDVGGDNEENLYFIDLSVHEYILIVANIFNKSNTSFSSYDGKVVLTADNKEYTVPLISQEKGSYCIIACIDNRGEEPKLININKITNRRPKIKEFMNR